MIGLQSRIEEAEQATAQLSAAVENKALTNKELAYAIEHSSDPETIERVARDKLGLVYPGEQIFYDVNGN
ncbi:MAG: septum formation initiator family protein [Clostridiales bacterium]|nr:septum formation initiator family protein [Clostridiales bacterium]